MSKILIIMSIFALCVGYALALDPVFIQKRDGKFQVAGYSRDDQKIYYIKNLLIDGELIPSGGVLGGPYSGSKVFAPYADEEGLTPPSNIPFYTKSAPPSVPEALDPSFSVFEDDAGQRKIGYFVSSMFYNFGNAKLTSINESLYLLPKNISFREVNVEAPKHRIEELRVLGVEIFDAGKIQNQKANSLKEIMVEQPKPSPVKPEPAPVVVETTEPEQQPSSFSWLWIGAIVVIAGVVAFLVIQRQRA